MSEMVRLIDITGKAISGEWGNDDETGNGIPVLRTTNFTNDGSINYSSVVTRNIKKKYFADKYLQNGDIIIEKSGGSDKQPVGRVVYFDGEKNKYLFNNFTGLLRVIDKSVCYPKYLFYCLFNNYRKGGTLSFQNKTTGLHNLKTDDFVRSFTFPLPPLPEQRHIAAVLDKVSELIALRKRQLDLLDEMVKARFVEMFGSINENPKHYPMAMLKDICHKITDGKHGGCEQESNSGYFYVGAREIFDNSIHYETAPQITYTDFAKDYKRCNIEIGDFVIVNTGATIGKSAIATSSLTERTLLQKSVALLKVNTEHILSEFLRYCYIVNPSMYMVESASAQPNLLLSKIKTTVVYTPPIKLQNQFADFVQQVDKSKAAVQQGLDRLILLKSALMQEYFG